MQLSPLDLLTFYDSEQDVIRCLIRRPRLTAREISTFTKIPLTELESILNRLVKGSKLTEEADNDKQIFSIAYANGTTQPSQPTTKGNSLLDTLFG